MEKRDTLKERAQNILRENDRGGYTVPNGNVYPFQWNWDSPFTALGWFTFDEARGWQEIEKLLEGQWDNGMIPSIVFHKFDENYFPGPHFWQTKSASGVPTTGITQIPMVIPGVELMYHTAKEKDLAEKKATFLFDKLFAYQNWFYQERRFKKTGLCQIFHGWESMDNSPLWDEALAKVTPTETPFQRKDKNHVPVEQRPKEWDYLRYISIVEKMRDVQYSSLKYAETAEMVIVDAALNGVLLESSRALLRLSKKFGTEEQRETLKKWIKEAEESFPSLWDRELGLYVDYDVVAEKAIKEPTSGGLVPLFASLAGEEREAFRKTLKKWISQNLPSTFTDSPKFEADRYWRGPSWSVINFIIYCGALKAGWIEEANEIKERSLKQIQQGSFYENFNPLNSKGGGGADFSWTAACYLFWLNTDSSYDFKSIVSCF